MWSLTPISLVFTFSAVLLYPARHIWLTISAKSSPQAHNAAAARQSTKIAQLQKPKDEKISEQNKLGVDCPYDYILRVYGKNHFAGIVKILDSGLKERDPARWQLIMEIMDCVHFAAILVDDIADNSDLRKGQTAAHIIFGSSETVNRAYLRLSQVMLKCAREQPQLIGILLKNLEEIHEGQDISLVWRRDGNLPTSRTEAVKAYRQSAYLKTGALFRLVGQLVTGDESTDELMTRVGWYCHLQNDCKNVYSKDVIAAKGALAEDLENGEYSFPIILALHSSQANVIRNALNDAHNPRATETTKNRAFVRALEVIQSSEVRDVCLGELVEIAKSIPEFVALWGRKEKMDSGKGTMK